MDKGRIIDLDGSQRLPATIEERQKVPRSKWSRVMNELANTSLPFEHAKMMKDSAEDRAAFEKELLTELQPLRKRATELGAKFKAGKEVDTVLTTRLDVDEDADEDDEIFTGTEPPVVATAPDETPLTAIFGDNSTMEDLAEDLDGSTLQGDRDEMLAVNAAIERLHDGRSELRKPQPANFTKFPGCRIIN